MPESGDTRKLSCPSCDKVLKLSEKFAGKKIKCPGCETVLLVAEDLESISEAGAASPAKKPVSRPTAKPAAKKRPPVVEKDEWEMDDAEEDEDFDDAPPRPSKKKKPVAAKKRKGKSSKSNPALIIILLSVGFVLLLMCGGIGLALVLPAVQQSREAARIVECRRHLQQIGLALHNYHDVHNTLPPAFIADAQGKPMHSWRVLILPYVDGAAIYSKYNFSEPWDGPNNSQLLKLMPSVYACPSSTPGSTMTAYVAVFGERCCLCPTKCNFRDITDGLSNTLMVAEAAKANIPWMKPDDVDPLLHPQLGDPNGFSSRHRDGIHVLVADGSVRFISLNIPAATFQALCTRNGGEVITDF